jgi:oxalate---CoA ligase
MTIADLVAAAPHRSVALVGKDGFRLTYGNLGEQIARTVAFLNRYGVGLGDAVAVVLPNGPQLVVAFASIASAAECAPLNPAYTFSEFLNYLKDVAPKVMVTEAGFCPAAQDAAAVLDIPVLTLSRRSDAFELEAPIARSQAPCCNRTGMAVASDVCLLLHSSGTASRPKLIPLTQRNLCASARNIADSLCLSPEDRCLNIMPMFHVHGLVGAFLASIASGASLWCAPGFHPLSFSSWLETVEPTWYTAVPTMHQAILSRLTRGDFQRPRLRFVRSCSAPLHAQTAAQLEALFDCPAIQAYGMTEAAHQICSNPLPPGVRVASTVGVPTPAGTAVDGRLEAVILDEFGAPWSTGVRGEVAIRGVSVIGSYRANPEANANAFSGGWLRTGDEGFLDVDGYLTLTGRLKEIINCGGEKISPAEIDEVLSTHKSIDSAVAFAVPCRQLGERVYAAVIPHNQKTVTESEIKRFAAERLAKFKVPHRVLIVNEIPKGPTGKIQRLKMAERLGLTNDRTG